MELLFMYAGSAFDLMSSLALWIVLIGLGGFAIVRGGQPGKSGLRLLGGALVAWALTGGLGWIFGIFTDTIQFFLEDMGMFFPIAALIRDLGDVVGAVLLGIGGFGAIQVLAGSAPDDAEG